MLSNYDGIKTCLDAIDCNYVTIGCYELLQIN